MLFIPNIGADKKEKITEHSLADKLICQARKQIEEEIGIWFCRIYRLVNRRYKVFEATVEFEVDNACTGPFGDQRFVLRISEIHYLLTTFPGTLEIRLGKRDEVEDVVGIPDYVVAGNHSAEHVGQGGKAER